MVNAAPPRNDGVALRSGRGRDSATDTPPRRPPQASTVHVYASAAGVSIAIRLLVRFGTEHGFDPYFSVYERDPGSGWPWRVPHFPLFSL